MSLTVAESPHSVRVTADRTVAALHQRGITLFARVDHAAGAKSVGLELADEELLVFGDPKAGTLLMQDDPTVGYELPLRLLVWDAGGRTKVGYRNPAEMAKNFTLSNRSEVLNRMGALLSELVAECTGWPLNANSALAGGMT